MVNYVEYSFTYFFAIFVIYLYLCYLCNLFYFCYLTSLVNYSSFFGLKFSWFSLVYKITYFFLSRAAETESEGHSVVSNSLRPHGPQGPWSSPGQNIRVGSLPLLQGIFPIQGSNPSLTHFRQILYHLSHRKSPEQLNVLPNGHNFHNPCSPVLCSAGLRTLYNAF